MGGPSVPKEREREHAALRERMLRAEAEFRRGGTGVAMLSVLRPDAAPADYYFDLGQRVHVGRTDGPEGVVALADDPASPNVGLGIRNDRLTRLAGPHLRISHQNGWQVRAHEQAKNPLGVRHWGSWTWDELRPGEIRRPRDGLLAIRMPAPDPAPMLLLQTVDGRHADPRAGTPTYTDDEPTLTGTQVEAAMIVAARALAWPPRATDSAVPGWREFGPTEGERLRKQVDAVKRALGRPDATTEHALAAVFAAGYLSYDTAYREQGRLAAANRDATITLIRTHLVRGAP